MREHVLLFCLLGLVLIATIILVTAPGAVTWALALIDELPPAGPRLPGRLFFFPFMAATSKCLAQMNKSVKRGTATKRRHPHSCGS